MDLCGVALTLFATQMFMTVETENRRRIDFGGSAGEPSETSRNKGVA